MIFEHPFTDFDACTFPNNETGYCVQKNNCKDVQPIINLDESLMKGLCEAENFTCCKKIVIQNKCASASASSVNTSKSKCTNSQKVSYARHRNYRIFNSKLCGISSDANRISNGNVTQIEQYPWMALLNYRTRDSKGQNLFLCGGSLISNKIVSD